MLKLQKITRTKLRFLKPRTKLERELFFNSFDSNYDEEIPMKKQGSGKVYDSTPTKRGYRKPKSPVYTAKKKTKDIYMKKGDDSSYKEEQSKGKKKDAGNNRSDPNNGGDDREDDYSGD